MTRLIHSHSEASLQCAEAQPNRLIESSATSGWSSLLLDYQEGAGVSDTFETHPTEDLTLVVACAGQHQIEAHSGGMWRSAVYQSGNAGMTPPGETARLRWRTPSSRQSFRTMHVYLPQSLLCAVAEEYSSIGRTTSTARLSALSFRDETITTQVSALLAASRAGEPDIYAAAVSNWLVTHLLSRQPHWDQMVDDPRRTAAIPDRRLARVIEFMSCHLDRALTLDELAREAGISVHHFGRRFRERAGMGPAAYLTKLRMEKAELLLTTTDLPVSDVALRCGYLRPSAFSTAFLRHSGMTPSRRRSGH